MTETNLIFNGRENTVVDIQEGAGQPWKVLTLEDFEVQTPSGGGRSVTREWGVDSYGSETYRGKSTSGNPAPFTFNAMFRETVAEWLTRKLEEKRGRRCDCGDDNIQLRIRYRCGDKRDVTNYDAAIILFDLFNTSVTFNTNLANGSTGDNTQVMRQLALDAAFDDRVKKLQHLDVSKQTSDIALNKIQHVCDDTYVAISDADSTPGYQSQNVPILHYTQDGWVTRSSSQVTSMLNADGTDVVVAGGYVFVASPDAGVSYALLKDVLNGLTQIWTATAWPTAAQFPNALTVDSNGTLWAVGDGGYVWRSTDGGFTWAEFDAAQTTTENLTAVSFESGQRGAIVGANGTLLIYNNGALSAVTTGLSDEITTVSMPGRNSEIAFGTDAGEMYRTLDAFTAPAPIVTELQFALSGSGRIEEIRHVGYKGANLFVLQSNTSSQTRVLRDLSGGAMGNNVEVIGAFTSPANQIINSIALKDANTGFTVGELDGTHAFIGQVTS